MSNPTICSMVQYALTDQDVAAINRRRFDARFQQSSTTFAENASGQGGHGSGYVVHTGNDVASGQVFPAIVVSTSTSPAFNVQVILDGNDTLWVTSTTIGDGPGKCAWPAVTNSAPAA